MAKKCGITPMVKIHQQSARSHNQRYRFRTYHIHKAYVRPMEGDIAPEYGLIWYSTSILGSWNDH